MSCFYYLEVRLILGEQQQIYTSLPVAQYYFHFHLKWVTVIYQTFLKVVTIIISNFTLGAIFQISRASSPVTFLFKLQTAYTLIESVTSSYWISIRLLQGYPWSPNTCLIKERRKGRNIKLIMRMISTKNSCRNDITWCLHQRGRLWGLSVIKLCSETFFLFIRGPRQLKLSVGFLQQKVFSTVFLIFWEESLCIFLKAPCREIRWYTCSKYLGKVCCVYACVYVPVWVCRGTYCYVP